MAHRFDLVTIGNAVVDVVSMVEEEFLTKHQIEKGVMTLVDHQRVSSIFSEMGLTGEISGGAAANTAVGAAAMGLKVGFIGRIADDRLGQFFANDIRENGIHFEGPIAPKGTINGTSHCLVAISPDGDRSMCTYLGASRDLKASDINADLLSRADWAYFEGYLFDTPDAKAAYRFAIDAVKEGGGKTSLTLSDPICVNRHRGDFLNLITQEIDLLFANKRELLSLYQTESIDAALSAVSKDTSVAAITMSEKGAVVVRGDTRVEVPAQKVDVVDVTGAGDLFSAGFFLGLTKGADDRRCAAMGCAAAAEVIGDLGARSEADLQAKLAQI